MDNANCDFCNRRKTRFVCLKDGLHNLCETHYKLLKSQPNYTYQKCVICGVTEVQQNHHIRYEPELTIPVCCSCHKHLHQGMFGIWLIPPEKRK